MLAHMAMVKTTVYLDPETALSLRHLAESEGKPQAQLIRDAVATYVQRGKRPKLPGVGEFDSGHTDTSERAEEILRKAAKRGRWR